MRGKLDNNNEENYFFNSSLGGGSIPVPPDNPDDSEGYDDYDDDIPNEACWMFDTISALMAMDKPFGIIFDVNWGQFFTNALASSWLTFNKERNISA